MRARVSALHTHALSLFSPFLSFLACPQFLLSSSFPFSLSLYLSLFSQDHGTRTHATTILMCTRTNTICCLWVFVCDRMYACRGIKILSKSAHSIWKGYLACSRYPFFRARSQSILVPLPLSLQKHPNTRTNYFS